MYFVVNNSDVYRFDCVTFNESINKDSYMLSVDIATSNIDDCEPLIDIEKVSSIAFYKKSEIEGQDDKLIFETSKYNIIDSVSRHYNPDVTSETRGNVVINFIAYRK